MENETVTLNTPNETADGQQEKETETATEDNSEVATLKEQNRQLFARAKKAEGFELEDGKWVKAQKPESKEKPESKKLSKQSDEFDNADFAYLAVKGVEGDEEIDFLKSMRNRTGEELRTLLKDDYVQNKLKGIKNSKVVNDSVPTTVTGRGNQTPASQSVEYWLNKPDTEFPPNTYENTELINKINNARYDRAKRGR